MQRLMTIEELHSHISYFPDRKVKFMLDGRPIQFKKTWIDDKEHVIVEFNQTGKK